MFFLKEILKACRLHSCTPPQLHHEHREDGLVTQEEGLNEGGSAVFTLCSFYNTNTQVQTATFYSLGEQILCFTWLSFLIMCSQRNCICGGHLYMYETFRRKWSSVLEHRHPQPHDENVLSGASKADCVTEEGLLI